MYGGRIEGVGPRYCPSIEDKVVRFADKGSHQVFLEPEGLDTTIVYPNGISTSLPPEVQEAYVRSIQGLENVRITQPGYAIEYDYVDPRALDRTLAVQGASGALSRRADQRDDGIRGGGGPGPGRRAERGGAGAWAGAGGSRPQPGLHRGDGGRPGDPRGDRALSHVHVARGVPAATAGRQCRSAADAARPCARVRRGSAPGGVREEARGARCRPGRWRRSWWSRRRKRRGAGWRSIRTGCGGAAFELLGLPGSGAGGGGGGFPAADGGAAGDHRAGRARRNLCALSGAASAGCRTAAAG